MDAVIPWAPPLPLIEPHHPTAGRERRPVGLELMLRPCFLQQWFHRSEPAAEDAPVRQRSGPAVRGRGTD